METVVEQNISSSRRLFPGEYMDVTKVDDISDDDVSLAQDRLFRLCEAHQFPTPIIQVIEALTTSQRKNRHFISTIQVDQVKISSYPALYTSKNGAKLDALTRAIECVNRTAEEAAPEKASVQGETASEAKKMPSHCADFTQYAYSPDTDVYAVGEIYPAQPENQEVEPKVHDIYADTFNADEISEAELYGDAPINESMVFENSYPTASDEALQYENQEAFTEQTNATYAPPASDSAAQDAAYGTDPNAFFEEAYGASDPNEIYGHVYEVQDPSEAYEAQDASEPLEVQDQSEVIEVQDASEAFEVQDQSEVLEVQDTSEAHEDSDPNEIYGRVYEIPSEAYEESDPNEIYGRVYEIPIDGEGYDRVYQVPDPSDPYGPMYELGSAGNVFETAPPPTDAQQTDEYGNAAEIYETPVGDVGDSHCTAEPYSEGQYAQYAQEASEQPLDLTADSAQYYAESSGMVSESEIDVCGISDTGEQYEESMMTPDPMASYEEPAYAADGYGDVAQEIANGYDEALYQQVDPATGLYYGAELEDAQQGCYDEAGGAYTEPHAETCAATYAETYLESDVPMESYGTGAGTEAYEPELTYQESSETVVSTDSAFYDESYAYQNLAEAADQFASYETGNIAAESGDYETGFAIDVAPDDDKVFATAQFDHVNEEQMLVDGMASITLENEESGTPYYPTEGMKAEYADEYYNEAAGAEGYVEGSLGLDYAQVAAAAELYQPCAIDEIDIYQVDQLPSFETPAALSSDDAQAFSETDPAVYYDESSAYADFQQTQDAAGLAEDSYQCSTVDGMAAYQRDQEHQAACGAALPADATALMMQANPSSSYAQMNQYAESALSQTEVAQKENYYQNVPAEQFDADRAGAASTDVQCSSSQEAHTPMEDYSVEAMDTQKLMGSLETRLQSALIVNINFYGQVTLNLLGPAYDAFVQLEYKHKPNPVEECEIGRWYVVHHNTENDRSVKRAVAQEIVGNGESYIMHYPDEDYLENVPIHQIFEVENPEQVCRVPPQGVTCDVMSLTEKRVSPHTVEILLSRWLYRTVYIIPVDTSGAVPKVRLIDPSGELLEV